MYRILLISLLFLLLACQNQKKLNQENPASTTDIEIVNDTQINTADKQSSSSSKTDHQVRNIEKASFAPTIDGQGNDQAWEQAAWYPLDQRWIGEPYTPEDFTGRYKLTWTPEALFVLVEITDDVLYDQYADPLELWWDDDCVEIFVDEDNSGGEHQFNHNAFAYHVALDTKNVVDMSPTTKSGALYNDHVKTAKVTDGNTTIWEHKVFLFDDTYQDNQPQDPVQLTVGKRVGFSLAYCDNDASKERENFIGSAYVPGENKNLGYIDADTFGTIVLVDN